MEDSERLPRKLAAILYADVAGYSRLTGEDEDATHRKLSEYLDLISAVVPRHRGREMHYAGDAVLAMFEAVIDALTCAIGIQEELEVRSEESDQDRRLAFRIGLNLGDVIEDRGDIYGDGVNVAARLENLAEPGGICISEAVRGAVGKKLGLEYEFLGEREVKNIAEPVRVYRIVLDETAPIRVVTRKVSRAIVVTTALAALVIAVSVGLLVRLPGEPADPIPAMPTGPIVAVLPFTNMSDDPEQEYFSDGITEEIITELTRFRTLHVLSRNSTFQYKGNTVDVRSVGGPLYC